MSQVKLGLENQRNDYNVTKVKALRAENLYDYRSQTEGRRRPVSLYE
jgi:hypothetical protein